VSQRKGRLHAAGHPILARLRAAEPWARRGLDQWAWLPVPLAGAYVLLLVINLRSIVQSIYLSSDIVSAPFLGELYRQAPPGVHVVLGNIAWFPALFFEQATAGLPAHRQIWELAPYAFSLIGIGLVAWSTFMVAGRWAAVISASVLGAASPALLPLQFAWSIHALTYVEVAVLGAFLVLCVARDGVIGGRVRHVLLSASVGVITAIGLASDKLLAIAGLAPFVLCAFAMLRIAPRRIGRRVAITAAGVSVVALAGDAVLHRVLVADHISTSPFPISFSPYDQIASHVGLLVQSMTYLFYGDFGGLALSFTSVLKFLCAVVVIAAMLAGAGVMRTEARHLRRRLDEDARVVPTSGAVSAHLVFWSLVILLTSLGYVLSRVPVDEYTVRYLVPAAYGLAAVLSVVATRNLAFRGAVVAGACVLLLASTLASARHELQANPSHFPNGAVAASLLRLAKSEHLTYGYGGYWDAAPLSWQTKTAVQVYPVATCGPSLCPFPLHRIDSWYTPRPGVRTFLISDPTQNPNPGPLPSLGRPQQIVHLYQLTVYIYPYDIASKFGG
jgi:hypothetical protein